MVLKVKISILLWRIGFPWSFVSFCAVDELYLLLVGHALLAINGEPVTGKRLPDGREAMEVIKTQENYPISLKFGRPKLTTNERIMLASMFHP